MASITEGEMKKLVDDYTKMSKEFLLEEPGREIPAQLVAIRRGKDGDLMCAIAPPMDKMEIHSYLTDLIIRQVIDGYLLITEAWVVKLKRQEGKLLDEVDKEFREWYKDHESLEHHPDRIDVLMVMGYARGVEVYVQMEEVHGDDGTTIVGFELMENLDMKKAEHHYNRFKLNWPSDNPTT